MSNLSEQIRRERLNVVVETAERRNLITRAAIALARLLEDEEREAPETVKTAETVKQTNEQKARR